MTWTDEALFDALLGASEAEAAQRLGRDAAADPELAARATAIAEQLAALALAAGDTTNAPSDELRASIVASIDVTSRFEPLADVVSELLGVSREEALAQLDALDDLAGWVPGVLPGTEMRPVSTDREDVGIVWLKMPAGMEFPEHEHLGDEQVLVVQGRYIDHAGRLHPPGTVLREPPGTEHHFHIAEDGPDFICLAVVHGGIRIGENDVTSDALYGG